MRVALFACRRRMRELYAEVRQQTDITICRTLLWLYVFDNVWNTYQSTAVQQKEDSLIKAVCLLCLRLFESRD